MRLKSFTLLLSIILLLLYLLTGCATCVSTKDLAGEYYNIGNAYFDLEKYEKAVFYYKEAIKLDDTLVQARFNLALSYLGLKQNDAANDIFLTLLKEDSNNTKIMASLAYSYHLQGEDKEALSKLDRILEISPEDTESRNNRAIILWELDRKEEAEEEFKTLLKYMPDDLKTQYNLGKLLVEETKYKDALVYLNNYIQLKPEDNRALNLLAKAYTALEDYSRALKAYSDSLAIDDKQADIWFYRAALLLTKIEDPGKGLTYLRQSLKLGFRDVKKLGSLLNEEDLLEKEKVKAVLKEANIKINTVETKETPEASKTDNTGSGSPNP